LIGFLFQLLLWSWFMTSITIVVRRREPDGTRTPISAKQFMIVGPTENSARSVHSAEYSEDEKTLAERVFLFLDQRGA
jgi:hypothetical protein